MNEKWFRSPFLPAPHPWTLEQTEETAARLLGHSPEHIPDPWAELPSAPSATLTPAAPPALRRWNEVGKPGKSPSG